MKFQLVTFAVATTAVVAQSLSSGCTGGLLPLAVGDLGNCLQLSQIITVLGASGSVIAPLDTYLTSLCSSNTPRCSNATLSGANSTITSSCASDISGGGNNAATVQALQSVLTNYPYFYNGGCARNSTTNDFCVVSILNGVQNSTGQQITFAYVSQLLSGSGDAFTQLNSALNTGQLCTGCVSKLYQEAVAANASVSSLPAAQSLVSRCGSGFGTNAVSGVSSAQTSPAQTSPGTGSSASATSRAAGFISISMTISVPAIAGIVAVIGGITAGGLAVL